ncbi:conserved exported hypothetical protein [Desulfamplus magnetovallimortis]|uniref:Uncharacterized protein n=1 Tax=Desulfamplus magnetovallimortis TaxID=1246637 RepID=A0A1W1H7J0_9BACT|nr:CRISPR-associated protein Csx20 [Desulfamplus magnetovallimortis]SLM28429.1 conserved exported hypothetical protein [Desulfamplus magnetovallimortis]
MHTKTKKRRSRCLFLLFSHTPTTEQIEDARLSLGVESIVAMPQEIKNIWQQFPPDVLAIEPMLKPVKKWLSQKSNKGDFALIQGDFGATFLMVLYAKDIGLVPIYATTERKATEIMQSDGTLTIEHIFKHRRFREYGK